MVAQAGVGIVALPQTNLFLQSRTIATAPPRGLTAVAALRAAGVRVGAGADNVQDPFNTMGRVDPCETASLMVTAGHVEPEAAWSMVADDARAVMGLAPAGPVVGAIADLVALSGSSVRSAVADGSETRTVVRRGRVVAETAFVRRTGASSSSRSTIVVLPLPLGPDKTTMPALIGDCSA